MTHKLDPRTPVLVGAGQLTHRADPAAGYPEPVVLIAQALRNAAADSGTGDRLLCAADSIRSVAVTCWQYRDVGALVAAELGIAPRETVQTNAFGGDGPQRLLNETARQIAAGMLDVALLCGGEAVASLRAARKSGAELGWAVQDELIAPSLVLGEDRYPVNEAEAKVGLPAPIDMYALIESAVRAQSGESPDEHLRKIAGLWSRFSQVAAQNPYAWIQRAYGVEELATASSGNRPVSSPYLKLLSANIQVDQAAGLIMCSAEAAQRAGVTRDRWVFVHAGAQAQDEWHVSERHELAASPAIRAAGRAVLDHCGLAVDQIAQVDLYSCFPAAVQIAAGELGLSLADSARPLTVTGGLTFAGGPGNNYTTHAIATLVSRLRVHPEDYGVATALGWYATKHAIGIYSATPPAKRFASIDAIPEPQPARRARTDYAGAAVLEAFTVQHDRDGTPSAAVISAITPSGDRALVRTELSETVRLLLERDRAGSPVTIMGSGELDFDGSTAGAVGGVP